MQTLLQKTRRLNRILQRTGGQPVIIAEVSAVMRDVIEANVYVLNRKGKVLGKSVIGDVRMPENEFPREFNESLLDIHQTAANINREAILDITPDIEKVLFDDNQTTIVPIVGGGERLGTLLLFRPAEFTEADLIIAEYGATVVGMEILRAKAAEAEAEARNKAIVQMALNTLSYSEQEAVEHIFKELDGREGLLVASKIADRVGITRSVIVNALRKFESAGVIESRSLGMKGTYIKIINDQLIPELEKLLNR